MINSRFFTNFWLYLGTMETWMRLQEDLRKLDASHMRCRRTILGISWYDFVRNTEVFAATNLPCIQDIITRRRNSHFDHVVRRNDRTPAHRALLQAATAPTGSFPSPTGVGAQVTRATRGYSRLPTVHPSAFVLNGPRLNVVDTLG